MEGVSRRDVRLPNMGIRPPLPVRITIRIVLSLFPVFVRTAQKIGKQKEPIDSLLQGRISAEDTGSGPKDAEPPRSLLLRASASNFQQGGREGCRLPAGPCPHLIRQIFAFPMD